MAEPFRTVQFVWHGHHRDVEIRVETIATGFRSLGRLIINGRPVAEGASGLFSMPALNHLFEAPDGAIAIAATPYGGGSIFRDAAKECRVIANGETVDMEMLKAPWLFTVPMWARVTVFAALVGLTQGPWMGKYLPGAAKYAYRLLYLLALFLWLSNIPGKERAPTRTTPPAK